MQSDKMPTTGGVEQGHECLSWVVTVSCHAEPEGRLPRKQPFIL